MAELRRAFRPEFLNRLDEIILFKPLTKENLTSIIDLLVNSLRKRLADRSLDLVLTDAAKQLIIDRGYDPLYGARPLRRVLQSSVETLVARTILRGDLKAGSTITLEAWDDSFKPNQDWNHLWGAAPGNIIPSRLMGVMPLEPGFAKVRIQPQPGSLEHAEMALPTIRGTIRMKITNTPLKKSVSVDLPANMEAEIILPEGFELIH